MTLSTENPIPKTKKKKIPNKLEGLPNP